MADGGVKGRGAHDEHMASAADWTWGANVPHADTTHGCACDRNADEEVHWHGRSSIFCTANGLRSIGNAGDLFSAISTHCSGR